MKPKKYLPLLYLAALLVVFQIVCSVFKTEFYLTQIIMAAYYSMVVLGLCLLMGYAGQISLGHAGFFAIGGYTSAFLTTVNLAAYADLGIVKFLKAMAVLAVRQDLYGNALLSFTPWVAFAAAILLTIGVAFLIGVPVLKLKGHYLAMATLGFGIIIQTIVIGVNFLGEADGITRVPAFVLLPGIAVTGKAASRVLNYYICWAVVITGLVLAINLIQSRIGRAFKAIHGSEEAARAMGVNTPRYKVYVFVLSAVYAAVGGILLTHYNGGIGPSEASTIKSVRYLAIVAAGGMDNIWSTLFMGVVLNFLSLRGFFGSYDDIFFGSVLIAIMLFAPKGLFRLGILNRLRQWFKKRGIMEKPLLEIMNLNRAFGGLQAIQDVSFSVLPGIIKSVIGPNGAGKSTLFNLVAGNIPANSGTVLFRGRKISGLKDYEIASRGISRTFQTTKLFANMTVRENVMLGRHTQSKSGFLASLLNLPSTWREEAGIKKRSQELLATLGLGELAEEPAANLSFGKQRLVEIARALATDPVLLMLDEPAAGLNIYETEELARLIGQIKEQWNITVLLVEHDISLVMNISDEIVVLDQGKMLVQGLPADIQKDPQVIKIYLGEDYA